MTKTTQRSVWLFWLPLGLAIAVFFLVTFVGNILVIGSKLGFLSSDLELGFYALVLILCIWSLVAPLVGVLAQPVLALDDVNADDAKVDLRKLKQVARQLLNARVLPPEEHVKLAGAIGLGSDLREPLAAAVEAQRESAKTIIRSHAVRVLVATAVSQSGRLDAIAVLVTNFRLIRSLVKHFGYRPPLPTLIKIYSQIFLASLIADKLDDVDFDGVLSHVGSGAMTVFPGTALVVNSLFDGTGNALFTLRVGFVTRKCLLNAGSALTRSEIRKLANREARQEFVPVVKEALLVLPGTVKQIAKFFLS